MKLLQLDFFDHEWVNQDTQLIVKFDSVIDSDYYHVFSELVTCGYTFLLEGKTFAIKSFKINFNGYLEVYELLLNVYEINKIPDKVFGVINFNVLETATILSASYKVNKDLTVYKLSISRDDMGQIEHLIKNCKDKKVIVLIDRSMYWLCTNRVEFDGIKIEDNYIDKTFDGILYDIKVTLREFKLPFERKIKDED